MAANDKEIWKAITYIKGNTNKKYMISNHGRLASYDHNSEDKYILKQHLNGGFPMATVHIEGKSKALFAHHALAHAFLKKTSPKQVSIIHLDYNKANNDLSNLKWVTKKEQVEHSMKSPYVIQAAARKVYNGATARKLNEKKVIALKKEIWNPKRKATFKQLATKYGIAEMNLYRIKNGEMWFHVHVEGEPIFPRYKEQLKNIEFHTKVEAKELAISNKKKAAKDAKLKVSAEKKKKREAEKKARQEKLIKNRKQKAIERIAIEKRKIVRAAAAKKTKEEKAKRLLAYAKIKATRLIASKKAKDIKEKKAAALEKAKKNNSKKKDKKKAAAKPKKDKKSKKDKKKNKK
jgi:hypothetical protein